MKPAACEQPPEVVARVREVRAGGIGEAAGVDAAEDDGEPGSEHVGDRGGWGLGALCRFGLARFEARLEREPDPLGERGGGGASARPAGTTLTVSSLPRQP